MREIKFRVFDKASKYNPMHIVGEDSHDSFWIDSDNVFHYRNLQNGEGSGEYGDYILMQYTGLKDKNGKEIYECDILTSAFSKRIVIFNENTCSFMLKDIELRNELFSLTNEKCKNLEIIGNIYENKELIGEKEQ